MSKNCIDNKFLSLVEERLLIPLLKDCRFKNSKNLEKNFKSNSNVEFTNELLIANLILNSDDFKCTELVYEPKPTTHDSNRNGLKTIDFRFLNTNEDIVYCDVKTIRPQGADSREKQKKYHADLINGAKYFPKNVSIDTDDCCYHDMFAARSKMKEYAIELENKIRTYSTTFKTHYVSIFCSNGFHWQLNELEDFVNFYFTGRHSYRDQFCNMETHDIQTKGLIFEKTISRFAYLERKESNVNLSYFVCPVSSMQGNKSQLKKNVESRSL